MEDKHLKNMDIFINTWIIKSELIEVPTKYPRHQMKAFYQ